MKTLTEIASRIMATLKGLHTEAKVDPSYFFLVRANFSVMFALILAFEVIAIFIAPSAHRLGWMSILASTLAAGIYFRENFGPEDNSTAKKARRIVASVGFLLAVSALMIDQVNGVWSAIILCLGVASLVRIASALKILTSADNDDRIHVIFEGTMTDMFVVIIPAVISISGGALEFNIVHWSSNNWGLVMSIGAFFPPFGRFPDVQPSKPAK